MKILVIGCGGREHALAWTLARSPRISEVLVAPGNAGTATEPGVRNVAVPAEDLDALLALAQREAVEITVVGPEAPLVAGVVDRFRAAGLKCFGPDAQCARLEGSKAWSKAFMQRHGIPTAEHRTFTSLEEALAYLEQASLPVVIKADGLAAGKGVVIAHSREEGRRALHDMLDARVFGSAGAQVVVEEFLPGEEASFIALVDGDHILPLASSQDHKARDDGDQGPNTGGMGAYSPAPVVTDALTARIMDEVMRPTVSGLALEGCRYTGFLYAGLMIDPQGRPRVLEFNCRLGDPETQPVLFRLESDLFELIEAALDGRLDQASPRWHVQPAVGVVLAAAGYPGPYEKGTPIGDLPGRLPETVKVFHAGTTLADGRLVTSGGRVLCVVARGDSVVEARDAAYAVVDAVAWPGAHWRRDIAYRAVARERR
ncbi:MAG: phosphoribosylamine--glycine ligase [Chromatiales bacterium]|nr:phosphoribosylamine--glycine ligase [Chromatiales bacterium]